MAETKQASVPVPGPEPKPAVGKNSLVVNTGQAFLQCLVFFIQGFLTKRTFIEL